MAKCGMTAMEIAYLCVTVIKNSEVEIEHGHGGEFSSTPVFDSKLVVFDDSYTKSHGFVSYVQWRVSLVAWEPCSMGACEPGSMRAWGQCGQ